MSRKQNLTIIHIDPRLTTPVYKQIVQCIYKNIENGTLKLDDVLPSVNQIATHFSLARGSVFSAYNELRSAGIIDAIPGKGYFVISTKTNIEKKIFLLFSTFTIYKETLFNALLNHLPETATLDLYFHYHSLKMFESLIRSQAANYNTYVIMPEMQPKAREILLQLDPTKTFLVDGGYMQYHAGFPGVYQNFAKDIYNILHDSRQMVSRYKRLYLVFPAGLRTHDIMTGFRKFGRGGIIPTYIIEAVDPDNIELGDAFIVIDDNHLVEIVTLAKPRKWKLGSDIGLISYNETSLKSIIGDGITTITTDFADMGKRLAGMIMSGKQEVIENNFIMIQQNSF